MVTNRKYCSVYGCLKSTLSFPELSFFTLPTEKERHLKWLQLIGREDLIKNNPIHYYVCEIHFNTEDICRRRVRKILKKNCFPSLHLPTPTKADKQVQADLETSDNLTQAKISNDLENITVIDLTSSSCSYQTNVMTSSDNTDQTAASISADTPRKRKLESELSGHKKQLRVHESDFSSEKSLLDMLYKLCDRFLTRDLAKLVKAQTILKPSHKGKSYSDAYKRLCINLYYINPQAYRLLQNTICLPCISTLIKSYVRITTEINDELMAVLKMKVDNMSKREKECSLVIDSMNLKTNLFYNIKNDHIIGFHEIQRVQSASPADHALVILVRGIFVKWYQPIGFSLISGCSYDVNISLWIDKIISKLLEIGLKIRVCVSHLRSDFLRASILRGISVNKTYFIIDNHKIYYIFDPLHLLKLVRNNLIKYDFHFENGSVAKYEHIVQFYEYDKKRDYKQANKLKNSHINPSNNEKLKIRYAAELLSRSVASGLSTLIDFKIIDESARATVEFIQMMNDLFDTLNSSNIRNSYLYKNAFSGTKYQKDLFNKMLNFFQSLELYDPKNGKYVTKHVKFISGFQITMKSILQLHEDLKQEGYPHLLTRRLNQDISKNLLNKIRSKCNKATEPTSRHFISAFRNISLTNLIEVPKDGKYDEDLTEFIVHLSALEIHQNEFKKSNYLLAVNKNDHTTENTLHEIVRSDYVQREMPEKKSIFYVAGALLKKCLDRHNNCELLTSYLDANRRACNYSAKSRYYHHKDNSTPLKSLVVPPNDFVGNIERMEQVFRKSFEEEHIDIKIGMSIYEKLKDVEFTLPCPCFPKIFLQKLFVRMRIYFTLTSNNKAFRTCKNKQNIFSVSNI